MKKYASLFLSLVIAISITTGSYAEGNMQAQSAQLNENGVKAMQAKNLDAALQLFKRAVSTDPYNLTAVYNLGGAYLSLKKDKEAIDLLEPYAQKEVSDPGIYVRLGDAYFTSKNIAQAKQSYEKALKLAPKYLGLQAKLGTLYALNNDLNNAEKAFKSAIEQNQKDGQSLANLASVLLGNGKAEESIQTAKRALQVQATPELYVTMGNAYEKLKDKKNALISFQRAHDLGDSRKELTDKIEQLKAHS